MDGATPAGHVVIYDDDRYDMGGVMAGLLPCDGVLLVTLRLENNAVYNDPKARVLGRGTTDMKRFLASALALAEHAKGRTLRASLGP